MWTPTLAGSGCLAGVTRAVLLEEIRVPGLKMIERDFAPRRNSRKLIRCLLLPQRAIYWQ